MDLQGLARERDANTTDLLLAFDGACRSCGALFPIFRVKVGRATEIGGRGHNKEFRLNFCFQKNVIGGAFVEGGEVFGLEKGRVETA